MHCIDAGIGGDILNLFSTEPRKANKSPSFGVSSLLYRVNKESPFQTQAMSPMQCICI